MNPAHAYEQSLVKRIFQPLAEQVMELQAPEAGDRVLDVAAGTGICLREVANRVGNACVLVGLDLNPAMVTVGRSVAEDAGIEIEWHEGSAVELPFEDESFDWVFCQHGLQFFPDRPQALKEMWRVLDDGGRAVIAVWKGLGHHPYSNAINHAGVQYTGEHILQTPTGPFSLGDPDELTSLIKQAGFQDVQVDTMSFESRWHDPIGALRMDVAGASAVVPSLQKLEDDHRADLINGIVENLEPMLDQYIEDGELAIRWHANVATTRK